LTGVVAQLRAEAAYMAYLHSLPDMAVLKFGVGRDITCSNCAIGAHCVAANTSHYVSPGKGVDTVAGEGAALESIQLRLAGSAPHLYGADWVVGSEPVTLLDESGRHATADAPYMLVTMAATRCTL
jgi:hypothetical protein